MMKCSICRQGETYPGLTTVTLTRGDTTIIIKGVPAEICDNCGEYYLDEAVSMNVLTQAEKAVAAHAEVEIIRYAA
jgi:YgiT-type zinc finger domain-containing protein